MIDSRGVGLGGFGGGVLNERVKLQWDGKGMTSHGLKLVCLLTGIDVHVQLCLDGLSSKKPCCSHGN